MESKKNVIENEESQRKIMELYGKEISDSEKVLRRAIEFIETNPNHDSPVKIVNLFLFTKALNTFWSTFILCREGLAFEAATNARVLFEIALNMAWILKEDSEYRAKRYLAFDMVWRKELYKNKLRYQSDKTIKEHLTKLIEDNEKVLKQARDELELTRRDLKYNWSGKSIYGRAQDVCLGKDYELIYSQLSEIEHSGSGSLPKYGEYEGKSVEFFPGPCKKWVREILTIATNYFFLVFLKVHEALGLDKSRLDEVRRILTETYGVKPIEV